MVRIPGKVLSCMFLLEILGIDPAQNLENCKRWLYVPVPTNSCIVNEHSKICRVNDLQT